ncbi:MAG: hypothetical protein ABL900_01615 [Burkholderiaceae bacterium]
MKSAATALLVVLAGGLAAQSSHAQVQGGTPSRATPVTGVIERFSIDPAAPASDRWASGTITVGGQVVILPRNLIITLPANWLTLRQLYDQRPLACPAGETGLARTDTCTGFNASTGLGGTGAIASILANRRGDGKLIAGEIRIDKGLEEIKDKVTFISFHDGYMRVGGDGTDAGLAAGVMVRLNDPSGVHTIQSGPGCLAGSLNCSADIRFTNDPTNYTFGFTTGYPACLPSEVTGIGARVSGVAPGSTTGVGDPFCPDSNRSATGTVVANSTRFAPVKVGDFISAAGNYESITVGTAAPVRFLSAHTIEVMRGLTTQDSPTQPDYMKWVEVEWDTGGFQNERVRTLLIGRTTLSNPGVDVYALDVKSADNSNNERLMASTVGCDAAGGAGTCTNQGIGATTGGIFKIRHDVDFIGGAPVSPKLSPCDHIVLSGRPAAEISATTCASAPGLSTLAQEFGAVVPITRELIGRSRHKEALNAGVVTRDILGNLASNGEYLTPVGIGFPEFDEINLDGLATPYSFEAQPWNLDRRLGPVGCVTDANDVATCETSRQALDPFPCSGLDPRTQAGVPAAGANRVLTAVADSSAVLSLPSCTAATTPPPNQPPAPTIDVLIATAQFRTTKAEWRVTGTAGPLETMTIVLLRGGSVVGTIGTAQSDAVGAFAFTQRGSAVVARAGDVVRVTSTSTETAVLAVTVRN